MFPNLVYPVTPVRSLKLPPTLPSPFPVSSQMYPSASSRPRRPGYLPSWPRLCRPTAAWSKEALPGLLQQLCNWLLCILCTRSSSSFWSPHCSRDTFAKHRYLVSALINSLGGFLRIKSKLSMTCKVLPGRALSCLSSLVSNHTLFDRCPPAALTLCQRHCSHLHSMAGFKKNLIYSFFY